MTRLDDACAPYIGGGRGCWHWHVPQLTTMTGLEVGGGSFYRRADALSHMKLRMREIITVDEVLVEYLTMKSEFIMDEINATEAA